jgi:drug/metabolite transporter (DMT)-like permease
VPERDTPALLAGLTTVALWGSAFVGIRAAGRTLTPGALTLGRLLVSCAILTVVAIARHERVPSSRTLARIALFGVLFLDGYSVALNAAERQVDAGTSAMVVNVGPLLIVVLAGLVLDEGFPRGLFFGCGVALAGCVLIGLATTTGQGKRSLVGLGLLVLATVTYAAAVVVQKTALRRATPFQVTWLGCAAATLVCGPFAPALARDVTGGGVRALAWTAYLGSLPTALGFATWSFALGRATAGRVASLNYLIPIVAILLGWLYLDEQPPLLAAAGGALCLAGVFLARRPGAIRMRSADGHDRRLAVGRDLPDDPATAQIDGVHRAVRRDRQRVGVAEARPDEAEPVTGRAVVDNAVIVAGGDVDGAVGRDGDSAR